MSTDEALQEAMRRPALWRNCFVGSPRRAALPALRKGPQQGASSVPTFCWGNVGAIRSYTYFDSGHQLDI
jgi:hypothetical protein